MVSISLKIVEFRKKITNNIRSFTYLSHYETKFLVFSNSKIIEKIFVNLEH